MAYHDGHDSSYAMQAPRHPVPQLQGPFEESMFESVNDDADTDLHLDSVTRRNVLLEAPVYTRTIAGRWKQKPGERFHPLWKLIAQISFGVYLLAEGMAKSEDEVMQILQAHVDEVDGFLERTTEDFDLAQEDIQERLRCLKLPLSHPATFDKMLEDRNFRLSIVEGNEKIEHIVERTTQAMKDSLKDVQKGFESTSCLDTYLQDLATTWHRETMEHEAVFVAMLGNVEGWRNAFTSLHTQGNKLGGSLKRLTDIINEMQARAGEVSRRLLHQARVQHPQVMGRPVGRTTPVSRFQGTSSKQLPSMPERPPLRQTVSHDPIRTSSQETLRRQALLGRSQTPQHDMPEPRKVGTGISPRIIQLGSNPQARVQSMVPSLLEAAPLPRAAPASVEKAIVEEEEKQPERYFPPIELPAHVPEETMRAAPMSKQNRLSSGLGLIQANSAEKRNSRVGTSALIDLLRTNHASNGSTGTPKSKSPGGSRRTSVVLSNNGGDDNSSTPKTKASTLSPPRSFTSDTTSQHTRINVRRPKKGVQHWFDALDDDLLMDDEIPVQEASSPQIAVVRPQPSQILTNQDTTPGTPSWAAASFAQAENRKEILKKGAFSSHPPDLPLGSPPLTQGTITNPLTVGPSQRRPSHASSVGLSTLGEPGPEVAASEAGSTAAYHRSADALKRTSALAPELVVMQESPPLATSKQGFIAEMEGSSPMVPIPPQTSSNIVVELEVPQQYFKLPPRPPQLPPPPPPTETPPNKELELQLKPQPQLIEADSMAVPAVAAESAESAEKAGSEKNIPDSAVLPAEPFQVTHIRLSASLAQPQTHVTRHAGLTERNEVVEQLVDAPDVGELLQNKVYVATPNIPLPPSPFEDEASLEAPAKEVKPEPPKEEDLYFLPALTYKAPPISSRLPSYPEPTNRAREAEPEGEAEPDMAPEVVVVEQGTPTQEVSESLTVTDEANADAVGPQAAPTVSAQATAAEASVEEYNPPMAGDSQPEASATAIPKLNTDLPKTTVTTLQREHKPATLKHIRNASSHGSQNGWKAFFTGQPSPVGSTLSIRSVKRESVIQNQQETQSPSLLSPTSASSRHAFPPSPVAESAKDVMWISKPLDDSKHSSKASTFQPSQSKNSGNVVQGLGIMMEGNDESGRVLSAAS